MVASDPFVSKKDTWYKDSRLEFEGLNLQDIQLICFCRFWLSADFICTFSFCWPDNFPMEATSRHFSVFAPNFLLTIYWLNGRMQSIWKLIRGEFVTQMKLDLFGMKRAPIQISFATSSLWRRSQFVPNSINLIMIWSDNNLIWSDNDLVSGCLTTACSISLTFSMWSLPAK